MLPRGSAIGMISSAAGLGWQANLEVLHEYLDITDFDEAASWAQDNNKADYMWSKMAINAYVAREAFGFLQQGIRINAILPGPTNTPLAQANAEMWLGFGADYREAVGIEASTPLEQAYPLLFLCSDAAAGVNGVTVVTDAGYVASGITESFPAATGRGAVPLRQVLSADVRPLPQLTPTNEWFWTSGADGRLRVQRCDDCQTFVHPPVPICPACRSRAWSPIGGVRARHRHRVHGQPPPVAAGLRAAVRDRDRRARRGPDRPPHDERRRLRPGRRAHRPGGGGPLRAARGRVAAVVRTDRRDRRARTTVAEPERPTPRAPPSATIASSTAPCSRASAARRSAGA